MMPLGIERVAQRAQVGVELGGARAEQPAAGGLGGALGGGEQRVVGCRRRARS